MEKYIGIDDGKVYMVIDGHGKDHDDALRIANRHFKTALKNLDYDVGFVSKDKLYLDCPCPSAKYVWLVWKR